MPTATRAAAIKGTADMTRRTSALPSHHNPLDLAAIMT
jgi:hypothetical protein